MAGFPVESLLPVGGVKPTMRDVLPEAGAWMRSSGHRVSNVGAVGRRFNTTGVINLEP